jgi:hypothetical protein
MDLLNNMGKAKCRLSSRDVYSSIGRGEQQLSLCGLSHHDDRVVCGDVPQVKPACDATTPTGFVAPSPLCGIDASGTSFAPGPMWLGSLCPM